MKTHDRIIESRTGLRMMMFGAGVLAVLLAVAGVGAGAEWDVYPGDSIQDAIDSAGAGDTIYVHAGTYVENVNVTKELEIRSESGNPNNAIVRAVDSYDHIFHVTADNVTVSGFSLEGVCCTIGIYLDGVHNNIINNNILLGNEYGINLHHSINNTLSNNTASNNVYGIYLEDSSYNNLINNDANSNDGYGYIYGGYGIYLQNSSNNTLVNNVMSNNRHNFGASGSNMQNDIDDSNLVDGKPIYYFINKSDIIIDSSSNPGVVYCINCQNISVKDLTLKNNGYGVYLYNTSNSNIDNNALLNNVYGFYLKESNNNTLQNNIANSNSWGGIELYYSSNNALSNNTASSNNNGIGLSRSSDNTLQGNTASNNFNGIRLHYSSNNNTLYHNNLINNTGHNAYDTGTNTWDSGSAGN